MNSLPTVSAVITTWNSERTLAMCLEAVSKQDYPKAKIEVLVVDGGSKDKTLEVAKKYGARIVKVDPKVQGAEYNKSVGVNKAKNDLLLLLDHDNILPHKNWLKRMVKPFNQNPDLVSAEPLRFHYDPEMTVLDRYFALIGGSDPVPYYFGKNNHLSYIYNKYNLWGEAKDKGSYYLIEHSPGKIPALGGNGALVRRKLLLKEAKAGIGEFFHIDVHVDLINKGFTTYAAVKETIIHLTNNKLIPFLARRKKYIEIYHFQDFSKRRYSVYEPKNDRLKLLKYIILSSTFIIPTVDAIRGFLKVRDIAWFVHPLMSFGMLFVYGVPTVKEEVKSNYV